MILIYNKFDERGLKLKERWCLCADITGAGSS